MDKDNIMVFEYTDNWHGFKQEMVAIYNKKNLSQEEARELAGVGTEHDNLIVVTKKQYDTVFKGIE